MQKTSWCRNTVLLVVALATVFSLSGTAHADPVFTIWTADSINIPTAYDENGDPYIIAKVTGTVTTITGGPNQGPGDLPTVPYSTNLVVHTNVGDFPLQYTGCDT